MVMILLEMIVFEMSPQQFQAFKDATGGVDAYMFNHLILFVIGLLATIWLLLIIMGIWQKVRSQKLDLGEALGKIAFAALIYIAVGSMIFF